MDDKILYSVYCLYSAKYDKIYIGYTSNLIQRFYSHNQLSNKGWTKKFRPWIVVYLEWNLTKSGALKREKFLKSATGRNFLRNLIIENYK